MNNKKGFTLIELLATIVVLSIVVGIVVTISINVIKNTKKNTYNVTLNEVVSNANEYVLENSDKLSFTKISGTSLEYLCVTVKNLIDSGYLRNNVVNSDISDNEKINPNRYIYLERDINSKAITSSVYLGKNANATYIERCGSFNMYTITYDANGGTGVTEATTCEKNTSCALRENGFTKIGYSFDGWYSSVTNGTKYGEIIKLTNDITVYAGWQANTYNVNLDNQGATDVGTTLIYELYNTNYYLDNNKTKEMTSTNNKITIPSKTGYTFGGYYTSTGGKGTQYINENGYITNNVSKTYCTDNNCKLYANWIETKKTVTITYKTILVGNCGRPNACEGGTKLVTVGEKYGDLCESDYWDDGSLWITPKRWYIDDGFDSWDWYNIYINDTTSSGKRVSPIDSNSIVQIAEDHYVYILSFCYVGGSNGETHCLLNGWDQDCTWVSDCGDYPLCW